jgi:AcrR family transcriptional regulator
MGLMNQESEPSVESATFGASSRDRILQAAKSLFATKGYENTSTVAIARAAGSSESQLMKHFGNKEGLLEAIFDESWQKINRALRQAIQDLNSPSQKFGILKNLIIAALDRDPELKLLMLLEGRRVRKEGHMVALSRGYLDFVQIIDEVLREMRAAGQLRPHLNPEAVRSALMGMLEGLMRDQLLARRAGYPAHYSAEELMDVFGDVLESFSLPPARIA